MVNRETQGCRHCSAPIPEYRRQPGAPRVYCSDQCRRAGTRARHAKYRRSAKRRASNAKYRHSDKRRAAFAKYYYSEKGKAAYIKRHTPEYISWRNALSRCGNPNNSDFTRYGGRGIRMCDAWKNSFASFLADMGPRPVGFTLDRIDNDGNYEPHNCRWADVATQMANRGGRFKRGTGEAHV